MINEGGFKIVAMKYTQLSKRDAEAFYAIHKERPFFGELVEFMTRGPIVAAILEKENAVADFRTLIGATNPAEAAEGTIRKKYASSIGENAVQVLIAMRMLLLKVHSILLEEKYSNAYLLVHCKVNYSPDFRAILI